MHNLTWICRALVVSLLLALDLPALAQGTLEDYQRAQQFLPGNLRHLAYVADVNPHWIEKTARFTYRKSGPQGSEFILIDAEKNTSAPAFDHARLAESLSRAAKQEYSASALPFYDIDFVDEGKSIRFSIDGSPWKCALDSYECQKESAPTDRPNEVLSPNKRWSAFVRDHNLFLRDTSTGTELQLTHDGVASWDYAAPLPSLRLMINQRTDDVKQPAAVFWSPDSSKLITYRLDSRNSGRFTSLQFVPPGSTAPAGFYLRLPVARRGVGQG